MQPGKPVRFGIKTSPQYISYEELLAVWLEADAEPLIEHAWLFDHLVPLGADPTGPCFEAWTLLAALAAQTTRLRLGVLVSSPIYRHPVLLAKEAVVVDIISQGRLEFGIGAGGNERDHVAYDFPLFSPGERVRRLREACEVIQRLWREQAPDFQGRYYPLSSAPSEPKPLQKPYPPFLIAGRGDQLLRVVAQYANIWNYQNPGTLEVRIDDFRERSAALDAHCISIGRDPAAIERSVQVFVFPTDIQTASVSAKQFLETGVTHLIFNLIPPYTKGCVHRLVEEVVVPLREMCL